MATPENAAGKQRNRGRPFTKGVSGNPAGKARGTRHRATVLAEQLLDGEAEEIIRVVITKAKRGDVTCLRLCLDRLLPPRRDRLVYFELPELGSASDASKATAAITAGVAHGQLTPTEAAQLSSVVAAYVMAIEAHEVEERLRTLERGQQQDAP